MVNSSTPLFRTQTHSHSNVFSVIYYRLFQNPAISNCFPFPLRVRNSGPGAHFYIILKFHLPAGLFSYPKRHFLIYISPKTTDITLPVSRKFELKKYSRFSSHFNRKIVGDNRSSQQIFTETVCWLSLSLEPRQSWAEFFVLLSK